MANLFMTFGRTNVFLERGKGFCNLYDYLLVHMAEKQPIWKQIVSLPNNAKISIGIKYKSSKGE
jgi:hypothetical protein